MKTGKSKDYVSYTQLSTYERCAKSYYISYHEKRKQSSLILEFGSFVHEVLAEINEKLIADKESFHPEDARKIFDKILKNHKFTFDIQQKAWIMVEKYALNAFSRKANILRAEYPVTTIIDLKTYSDAISGHSGAKVVGYVDLIEVGECLEIIDFKTGELLPSREDVKSNLQLNIYAYIVSKMFPELVGEGIKISYYHVPTGIKIPWMIGREDLGRLSEVENYIIELYNRLSAETEWKETPNEYCFNCPGKNDCAAYSKLISESYNPKVFEDVEELAKEFIELKHKSAAISKELSVMKDLLKSKMEEQLVTSLPTKAGVFNLIHKHKNAYQVNEMDYTELHIEKQLKKKGV